MVPCIESKASEVTTQMKAMVFKMLLVRLPFSIKVCFQTVTGKISVYVCLYLCRYLEASSFWSFKISSTAGQGLIEICQEMVVNKPGVVFMYPKSILSFWNVGVFHLNLLGDNSFLSQRFINSQPHQKLSKKVVLLQNQSKYTS